MTHKVTPEVRLIDFIFEKHGGTIAVAKKLKTSKQLVSLWKVQGFIPLKRLRKAADALLVPPICLNYEEFKELVGSNLTFREVKALCYEALQNLDLS